MKVDEAFRLESVADESEDTDCVTSIVEVEDETDCAEVRREESEGYTERRDEVSDETILLVSEDEQGFEHILEFETAESETVGSVVFKTSMM